MEGEINKNIVLIDFDNTIIDGDIIYSMFEKTLTKKEDIDLVEDNNLDYGTAIKLYYLLAKTKNITLEDIHKIFESMPFSKGINDLFSFIREQKKYFYLVLATGDDLYPTTYFLKNKKIFDLFDEFIGIPSFVEESTNSLKNNSNEGIVQMNLLPPHDCNFCDSSLCKTNEFKNILTKNKELNDLRKIYICDGWNDYCLAEKLLNKNDYLFVRKDYGLNKMLKKEKYSKNIKAKIYYWESGNDIINGLKEILSV